VGDVLLGVCVIIGAAVYLHADADLPVLQNGGPMGPQAFPVNAASAAGFTLAAYMLFTSFLQVALPRGILDF